MRPREVLELLEQGQPGSLLEIVEDRALVDPTRLRDVLVHGRAARELDLVRLHDLFGLGSAGMTGGDGAWVGVRYQLESPEHRHQVTLEVRLPLEGSIQLPSVADLWPTAAWLEREVTDLLGIPFTGPAGLGARLLSAEDHTGHLLRPAAREEG
jgi:NADH:ubiquinone oxidoreductase subunit C